jgi:hypothetical protein
LNESLEKAIEISPFMSITTAQSVNGTLLRAELEGELSDTMA